MNRTINLLKRYDKNPDKLSIEELEELKVRIQDVYEQIGWTLTSWQNEY
ncbi:hypothetical protein [Brevibacillus porteri]